MRLLLAQAYTVDTPTRNQAATSAAVMRSDVPCSPADFMSMPVFLIGLYLCHSDRLHDMMAPHIPSIEAPSWNGQGVDDGNMDPTMGDEVGTGPSTQ